MKSSANTTQDTSKRSSLVMYLEEIRHFPLLSREEEYELARRIRQHDPAALDKLICANLRFVVSVARKFQNHGVALADLVNEGNIGLINAAERFDESKGVKFISYAIWWIRQAIFQAIAENGHAVRVPVSRANTRYQISRHADRLRQELGREPTQQELSHHLQMSEKELEATMPLARPYLSLDAPLAEEDGVRLIDYVADEDTPEPGETLREESLPALLANAVNQLPRREAEVLRMCFGLDDGEMRTLGAIGLQLGVTRERVRIIRDRGIARLRKSRNVRMLEALNERA